MVGKTYNKLVRDLIPDIIENSGKQCRTRILSDDEYLEKRRALVKSYGIECKPSSKLIVEFIKDKLKSNGVIK